MKNGGWPYVRKHLKYSYGICENRFFELTESNVRNLFRNLDYCVNLFPITEMR